MIISIGSDHGGFKLKNDVISFLKDEGYEVIDNGTHSEESCDYPDFGKAVANDVASKKADYGVVICTTGEGICIAANKVQGIRCGIGYNDDVALLMRRHNDANVISFGAKFTTFEETKRRLKIFLSTEFEGGRHIKRVAKLQ